MSEPRPIFGLLAEFDRPEPMVTAVREARRAGYRRLEAYSPIPLEELAQALGFRETLLPWLALAAGLLAGAGTLLLQWWINVVDMPLNVGGRPLAAWPAFVMPAVQVGLLAATAVAVLGMLALNRLPRLRHPVLAMERFRLASKDRFFVLIESGDPFFALHATRRFLERQGAVSVSEVPG